MKYYNDYQSCEPDQEIYFSGNLEIHDVYNNGGLIKVGANQFIYIPSDLLNRSFHNDVVLVKKTSDEISESDINLIKDSKAFSQKDEIVGVGEVINVIKRSKQTPLSGILRIKSQTIYGVNKNGGRFYLFKPSDHKYPEFTVSSKLNASKYSTNIYIVARFMKWDITDKIPRGTCENIIGVVGDIDNEIANRLYVHDLVTKKLNKRQLSTELGDESFNVEGRLDLRGKNVISIDPPGCKDVDDALHIEDKQEDGYTIGVHIADVSNWVQPGTLLDQSAQQKMTSIYLPQKTLHMLPEKLSEDLCSLRENKDRYALSLLLNVSNSGEILGYEFANTIIKNRKQLTYEQAESLKSDNLKLLHTVCLLIHQHHPAFAQYLPQDQHPNSHTIVETCMILANTLCAEYLAEHGDNLILRVHPDADMDQYEEQMNLVEGNQLMKSYLNRRAQLAAQYKPKNTLSESQIKHYGLKVKYYSHFTSPIRRYIDIVNHRMIKSIISDNSGNEDDILTICDESNRINTNTKKFYRDLSYLSLINHLETNQINEQTVDAYVVDLDIDAPSLKVKVFIPEHDLTKTITLIHYDMMHLYEIEKSKNKIIVSNESQEWECSLFDKVNVILTPILTANFFHKKLRINLDMFNKFDVC
jgi:exoribonuclease R